MPRDSGGWSSKGRPIRGRCPRCKSDDERMMEIISDIYGKRSRYIYCNVCSAQWLEDDENSDT